MSCSCPTIITATDLDPAGRAFLPRAKRVLSTTRAAEELEANVVGMQPWSEIALARRGRDTVTVTVTAVPAQHGPDGSDEIQGPVLGFVLSAPGCATVYVSGDDASREVVRAIAQRIGDVDIAILNAGAVQLSKFDGAYLTLSADHAADAAKILGARTVIPLHFEGWAHFTRRRGAQGGVLGQRHPRPFGDPLSEANEPRSRSNPPGRLAISKGRSDRVSGGG